MPKLRKDIKKLYRPPRIEILLRVEAASYLRHIDEQEGELSDLTAILKHDAMKAMAEMNFTRFAQALLHSRGREDLVTSLEIKDHYEEINDDDPDD